MCAVRDYKGAEEMCTGVRLWRARMPVKSRDETMWDLRRTIAGDSLAGEYT